LNEKNEQKLLMKRTKRTMKDVEFDEDKSF